ncbi:MAG: hypothetical protein R3F60_29310 [bacterium]
MSEEKVSVDDLLGDEGLPLDPPPAQERRGDALRRLPPRGILLAVGGVLFLLLWYLSSVHHDKYYLVVDGDMVSVRRGWYFPFGSSEWVPSRAYKPFRLPAGITPDETGAMAAEKVDAQLMKLFRRVAEAEVADLKGGNAELAEDMLFRANKLLHADIEDERDLMRLLGDVHFHRGIRTLREVNDSFTEALKQFQLAAMRGGQRYQHAPEWVKVIERFQADFRKLAKESNLAFDTPLAGDAAPASAEAAPSEAP